MGSQDNTAYQAAEKFLRELGRPLSSSELASKLLAKKLVQSGAMHPARSISNTIDQAINNEQEPKALVHIPLPNGTIGVGLSEWKGRSGQWWEEIKFTAPFELYNKLQLAVQAKIKPDFESTLVFLLESGLKQEVQNIEAGIMKQLDKLKS